MRGGREIDHLQIFQKNLELQMRVQQNDFAEREERNRVKHELCLQWVDTHTHTKEKSRGEFQVFVHSAHDALKY